VDLDNLMPATSYPMVELWDIPIAIINRRPIPTMDVRVGLIKSYHHQG